MQYAKDFLKKLQKNYLLTGNCKSIADAADNKNLWIFILVNTNFILWNTNYENIKQRDENINEKMMELESIEWMTNI